MGGEVGSREGEEPGRGRAALVRADLGFGEPGVGIDSGVGVVQPDRFLADLGLVSRGRPALHLPAAAVRDPGSGIRPTFRTSACTKSPGCSCSYRFVVALVAVLGRQ